MTYIIPAILALLVGYILWQIKRERMSLTYELIESDHFPRGDGVGKYFIIILRNSGNRAVEDIDLKIQFEGENIESTSFSDKAFLSDINRSDSMITGRIPLLNPKEKFRITITAFSENQIKAPNFIARAIGATAVPKDQPQMVVVSLRDLYSVSIIAVLIILGCIWWITMDSKEMSKELITIDRSISRMPMIVEKDSVGKEGEPHSQQIIFAIFNRSGISHLFAELTDKYGEITYWKTGSFLMHKFLKDSRHRAQYMSAMEKLIEIKGMAPSSLGFNLYLIAKMEQHIGNKEKAKKYLDECKNKAPAMYEFLIAQDSYYDTKSLEAFLNKKN